MTKLALLCALSLWSAMAPAAEQEKPSPATMDEQAAEGSAEVAPADLGTRRPTARAFRPVLKYGVDDVLLEAGHWPSATETDAGATFRASPYLLWQPSRDWEFRAGFRLDAASQGGGTASYDEVRSDIAETYLRYRRGDTRLTLGTQTILWGRVDEVPIADRVSRVDLSRFVLDDLPERRRAQLALRWEQTLGDYKLDAVLLPSFRGARLPDLESVWSPVDQRRGRVIGVAPSPAIEALVRAARVREDDSGSGGAALRLTKTGGAVDFGLTLARTRQSLPYYRVEPLGPTLTAIHPYNRFVGVDAEVVTGGVTWRFELGQTHDVPVTLSSGVMDRTRSIEAAVGLEFFPGDDTRVNLQYAGRSLRTDRSILELDRYHGLNGELESTLAQGRWKLGLRFFSGLSVQDLYLGPRIAYVGWEPHEFYLAGHYFEGSPRSLAGFHRDHNLVALGVRTRF